MRPLEENVFNVGSGWAKSQMMANVQAAVFWDERFDSFGQRGHDVRAGVGPDEKKYRRILVYIVHVEGGKPIFGRAGFRAFMVVIPDGMPLLKKGDIVDVRSTIFYDYLKDFDKTRDGSAVIRILCPAEEKVGGEQTKKFKECASTLPWHEPWGESNRYFNGILAMPSTTSFLPSLTDYKNLKYSPYYNAEGEMLTNAIPPAPRPSIMSWVAPK